MLTTVEDSPHYRLRPAQASDFPMIRRMIFSERLNPIGLKWPQFILAVDADDCILGCGQIKIHSDGSKELASIAVIPKRKGEGIGSAIVRCLQESTAPPLYLTCAANLEGFYLRFEFENARPADLPPYFQRLRRIVMLLSWLRLAPPDGLRIMIYDPKRD